MIILAYVPTLYIALWGCGTQMMNTLNYVYALKLYIMFLSYICSTASKSKLMPIMFKISLPIKIMLCGNAIFNRFMLVFCHSPLDLSIY